MVNFQKYTDPVDADFLLFLGSSDGQTVFPNGFVNSRYNTLCDMELTEPGDFETITAFAGLGLIKEKMDDANGLLWIRTVLQKYLGIVSYPDKYLCIMIKGDLGQAEKNIFTSVLDQADVYDALICSF